MRKSANSRRINLLYDLMIVVYFGVGIMVPVLLFRILDNLSQSNINIPDLTTMAGLN